MALVYQMNVHQNSGHITLISAFFRSKGHDQKSQQVSARLCTLEIGIGTFKRQTEVQGFLVGYMRYGVKNRFFITIPIRGYIALSFDVIFDE